MIEVAFRQILTTATPVNSLIDERCYFVVRPQDERRPSVVLSLVSSIPAFNFEGRAGYQNGRMQISCLAPTYPVAKQLAQAARDALDGFTGTVDSTVVDYIQSDNIRDMAVVPLQGAGIPSTFGVNVDAKFMIKE